MPPKLFNRVVRIEGETDYEYFYVLTYLPDLQWCHVGPLEKRGVFPPDATRGRPGRDRWMLVPEEMGGERDCGAARCTIMEATEVKQTKESADEEEWDVLGPAAPPAPAAPPPPTTVPLLPDPPFPTNDAPHPAEPVDAPPPAATGPSAAAALDNESSLDPGPLSALAPPQAVA